MMDMETLVGLVGKGFVMMMADTSLLHNGYIIGDDYTKFRKLTPCLVVGHIGCPGETKAVIGLLVAKLNYHRIRYNYDMEPNAIVHNTRVKLAEGSRRYIPHVNMLLAAFEAETGPVLHYLDNVGTHRPVKCGSQGLGGFVGQAVLDCYQTSEMTEEEAYDLMKKAVVEIKIRYPGHYRKFRLVVVDKNGVHYPPDIS